MNPNSQQLISWIFLHCQEQNSLLQFIGVRSCFLLLLIQMQFERMHYTAGYPALFINGQASMAKSHPEDRRYLCRFHPCNEILMRLYEIIKTGKKQKTRPDPTYRANSLKTGRQEALWLLSGLRC